MSIATNFKPLQGAVLAVELFRETCRGAARGASLLSSIPRAERRYLISGERQEFPNLVTGISSAPSAPSSKRFVDAVGFPQGKGTMGLRPYRPRFIHHATNSGKVKQAI